MSCADSKRTKRRKGKKSIRTPVEAASAKKTVSHHSEVQAEPQLFKNSIDAEPLSSITEVRAKQLNGEQCVLCQCPRPGASSSQKSVQARDGSDISQAPLWFCPRCNKKAKEEDQRAARAQMELDIRSVGIPPEDFEALDEQDSEDKCSCDACKERRELDAQHKKDTDDLQQKWQELRYEVSNVYKRHAPSKHCCEDSDEIHSDLEVECIIDEEKIVELVDEFCSWDAHQLFQRLESQCREFVIDIKTRLLDQLRSGHCTPTEALKFVTMLLDNYAKLKATSQMLTPMLASLEKCHLKQFNLTWDMHTKHLYQSIVYADTLVQNSLSTLINQLRKGNTNGQQLSDDLYASVLRNYLKYDGEMSVVMVVWRECEQLLEKYNEEQATIKAKQKMLREDWNFFKSHRKLLESRVLNNKNLVNANNSHSLSHHFETRFETNLTETMRQMTNRNKSNKNDECRCPDCKWMRCSHDECGISHYITCGIINPELTDPSALNGLNVPPHHHHYQQQQQQHNNKPGKAPIAHHHHKPQHTPNRQHCRNVSPQIPDSPDFINGDIRNYDMSNHLWQSTTHYMLDVSPPSMSSTSSTDRSSSPILYEPDDVHSAFEDCPEFAAEELSCLGVSVVMASDDESEDEEEIEDYQHEIDNDEEDNDEHNVDDNNDEDDDIDDDDDDDDDEEDDEEDDDDEGDDHPGDEQDGDDGIDDEDDDDDDDMDKLDGADGDMTQFKLTRHSAGGGQRKVGLPAPLASNQEGTPCDCDHCRNSLQDDKPEIMSLMSAPSSAPPCQCHSCQKDNPPSPLSQNLPSDLNTPRSASFSLYPHIHGPTHSPTSPPEHIRPILQPNLYELHGMQHSASTNPVTSSMSNGKQTVGGLDLDLETSERLYHYSDWDNSCNSKLMLNNASNYSDLMGSPPPLMTNAFVPEISSSDISGKERFSIGGYKGNSLANTMLPSCMSMSTPGTSKDHVHTDACFKNPGLSHAHLNMASLSASMPQLTPGLSHVPKSSHPPAAHVTTNTQLSTQLHHPQMQREPHQPTTCSKFNPFLPDLNAHNTVSANNASSVPTTTPTTSNAHTHETRSCTKPHHHIDNMSVSSTEPCSPGSPNEHRLADFEVERYSGDGVCQDPHCDKHEKMDEDDECIDDDGSEIESTTSSSTNQKDSKYCDCCYCEFFGHSAPPAPATSRNYMENRDRLRQKLQLKSSRQEQRQVKKDPLTEDPRKLEELLQYINGENTNSTQTPKSKKKKARKVKVEEKNKQNDYEDLTREEIQRRKLEVQKRLMEEEATAKAFIAHNTAKQKSLKQQKQVNKQSNDKVKQQNGDKHEKENTPKAKENTPKAKENTPKAKENTHKTRNDNKLKAKDNLSSMEQQSDQKSAKKKKNTKGKEGVEARLTSPENNSTKSDKNKTAEKQGNKTIAKEYQKVKYDATKSIPKNLQHDVTDVTAPGKKKKLKQSKEQQLNGKASMPQAAKTPAKDSPLHKALASHQSQNIQSKTQGNQKNDHKPLTERPQINGVVVNGGIEVSAKKQEATKTKKRNKRSKGAGEDLDKIFMPREVDHESPEMDELEKEIEEFKRFCLDSTPTPKTEKVQVNVNVKDIFHKKKMSCI